MGKCVFCNKSAGLFKNSHQDCLENHGKEIDQYICSILEIVKQNSFKSLNEIENDLLKVKINSLPNRLRFKTSLPNETPSQISGLVSQMQSTYYNSIFEKAQILCPLLIVHETFIKLVESFIEDDLIEKEEYEIFKNFDNQYEITNCIDEFQEDYFNRPKGYNPLIKEHYDKLKSGIILSFLNDKNFENLPYKFESTVLLDKNDRIIWKADDIGFYQSTSKTVIKGGSVGVSVKVARGVYVRANKFRGEPIVTQSEKLIDMGEIVLTKKRLVFSGNRKSVDIPYNKISSINADEIKIVVKRKDREKASIFKIVDGWFIFNAINMLYRS